MANWCHNWLTVSGSSHDEVQAFVDATQTVYEGKQQFSLNALIPCPADLAAKDLQTSGEWSKNNWGCDTDARVDEAFLWDDSGLSASIHFDTRYVPPHYWLDTVGARYPSLTFELSFMEVYAGLSGWLRSENGQYSEERDSVDALRTAAPGSDTPADVCKAAPAEAACPDAEVSDEDLPF